MRPAAAPILALLAWVGERGGRSRVELARGSGGALARKLVANASVAYGAPIITLPFGLAVDCGDAAWSAPRLAAGVAQQRAADPAWDAGLGPYWRAIPGGLRAKEAWDLGRLGQLQDPQLAAYVRRHSEETQAVYASELPAAVRAGLPFPAFAQLTAHVATYAFAFRGRRYLLPLLDLLDHADAPSAYVELAGGGALFRAVAKRPLAPGEEITFAYNWGNARPDHSFLNYFFLQPRQRPPLLAYVDLPGAALPFRELPGSDTDEGLSPATREEQARLLGRLRAFPTTELEDREALARLPEGASPTERGSLEFRVQRKAALRLRALRIGRLLQQAA